MKEKTKLDIVVICAISGYFILQVVQLFHKKYIGVLSEIYIEQCIWQTCSDSSVIGRTFYR